MGSWHLHAGSTSPPTDSRQYGLQTAFSEIERLHHEVTSGGNPIEMDMKTRYVVKGLGKEQTIASKINIFLTPDGKINKVQDKWDGELPDSTIANVSRCACSKLTLAGHTWTVH